MTNRSKAIEPTCINSFKCILVIMGMIVGLLITTFSMI